MKKLRNKKTGEIVKNVSSFDTREFKIGIEYENSKGYIERIAYDSLSELNEDWEDYAPQEPLIKDEKVRKAVKAWADANKIDKCVCKDEMHCITFETERGMFISFEYAVPIPPEGHYTIAELCGEEE